MAYCIVCGNKAHSEYCFRHKPRKPIKQRGKGSKAWQTFRDEVARPYLDEVQGYHCACCFQVGGVLDVDHIQGRGSHPELRYELTNLQYLCRPCHRAKTDRRICTHHDII